ncbi:MAG: DUF2855 family protein [Halieaceae bacterium]
MSQVTELWVERAELRNTRVVNSDFTELEAGEVRVAIEKFALTSNNVTYAVSGDKIGYWQFYPAEDEWGKVPVWSIAEVVESTVPEISCGERLYGFFPMASHAVLQPGAITDQQFFDVSDHRRELPGLYNLYRRTETEAEFLREMEDERCLLFPLFATSFLLYDYLLDNAMFGAGQVLIGSASSKTGFGLAHLLHHDPELSQRVVALTSPGNVNFVNELNIYDQVVCYGSEDEIDSSVAAAYVDMSGDAGLTSKIHHHLQDQLVESCAVGATHWEDLGAAEPVPGVQPQLFFAPAQITKRDAEWGAGVVMSKAMNASADIARAHAGDLEIERIKGAEAAAAAWQDMVANRVSPRRGLMLSLLD